jgi:hypothetical protein
MQTGIAFPQSNISSCAVTSGAATITLSGGGNFPAGVNGQIIREDIGSYYYFPPGTTIVSGAGTATLTLSHTALATGGFVSLIYGAPVFDQYIRVLFNEVGMIDWYPWSTGGTKQGTTNPFIRMDGNLSRVGIGNYVYQDRPTVTLDVIGQATFGADKTQRWAYPGSAPINIRDSGSAGIDWIKVGAGQFKLNWDVSPSRLDFVDQNNGQTPLQLFMDGSGKAVASNLQAGNLAVSGSSVLTGTLQVGSGTGAPSLYVAGAAGQQKEFSFLTGSPSTGIPRRFAFVVNADTGSGNGGGDLLISNWTDGGSYLSNAISITRSTGVVTFAQPIVNGSDRRLKSQIEPVTEALKIISGMQGVFYKHQDADRRLVGLVAQDVIDVLPEVVFEGPPGGEKGDAEPMMGISYPNIVAVLVEAIKELAGQVQALKAAPT